MPDVIQAFETFVRSAFSVSDHRPLEESQHPFESRDLHQALPVVIRKLFDNGHYSQATFEAFKYLDGEVRRHSKLNKTGKALMMEALKETNPRIQLTPLVTESEQNEQEGYKFIFSGAMIAIRNPRGHDHSVNDDIGTCLDHLTLVSHLLRRLEAAGYACKTKSAGLGLAKRRRRI